MFLDYTCTWGQMAFVFLFSVRFTSLSLKIHQRGHKWQNFLLFYGLIIFLGIHTPYFVYQLAISGCLGCFKSLLLWVTLNEQGVQRSSQDSHFISFRYTPEVDLLDHRVVLVLVFWGNSILLSTVNGPLHIPKDSIEVFQFLYILTSICHFLL